ncbi:MAG: hypothetical protein M0C28_24395 [Candidatus Moduliflexus flocculans]|nr:hypothetical protein [Candidatus Moduliflexus flocculans]
MILVYVAPDLPLGRIMSEPPAALRVPRLRRRRRLCHMALPLITLVLIGFWGTGLRSSRNIVLGILQEDYIMAARAARGIPERRVLFGHTLRTRGAADRHHRPAVASSSSVFGSIIFEGIFSLARHRQPLLDRRAAERRARPSSGCPGDHDRHLHAPASWSSTSSTGSSTRGSRSEARHEREGRAIVASRFLERVQARPLGPRRARHPRCRGPRDRPRRGPDRPFPEASRRWRDIGYWQDNPPAAPPGLDQLRSAREKKRRAPR